jgi:hypothetical protein
MNGGGGGEGGQIGAREHNTANGDKFKTRSQWAYLQNYKMPSNQNL